LSAKDDRVSSQDYGNGCEGLDASLLPKYERSAIPCEPLDFYDGIQETTFLTICPIYSFGEGRRMPSDMPTRAELLDEFAADETSCFGSGATNNVTDIVLTLMSVVSSLAATILASATPHHFLAASFAAVPAACTSLQRIIDFRGRSHWYFKHAADLKALALSLRYAKTPDLEEFAQRRAELEVEGEQRWAQIGGAKDAQERKVNRRRKSGN
jgi:hypothetical protein